MRPSSSSPRSAGRPRRRSSPRAVLVDLAIVNVVAVALAAIFLNGTLGEWGGDNVQFLLLARALATGQGYVDLYLVGTPPHVHYPPLFPILLAPFVALGAPLVVLKGWTAVLSVAGLNAAYLLLASFHRRSVALLSVLCTLCAGAFLDPALSVMSEGPYLLVSALALLAVHRRRRDGATTAWAAVAPGVLIGAAILTRTVGVVLLPALAAHAAFDRRSGVPVRLRVAGALVLGAVACAVASPWFVWSSVQEGADRPTYVGEFVTESGAATSQSAERAEGTDAGRVVGRVAVRPLQNLRDVGVRLARSAGEWASGAFGDRGAAWFSGAFVGSCGLLALLTAAGLVRALALRRDAVDWYVAFYLALLAVWVGGGFRLLMPVLVFLFVYCHDGAAWLAGWIRRHAALRDAGRDESAARRAGIVTLVVLLIANLAVTTAFPRVADRLRGRYAPWWHEYLAAVRSLGSVARPDDLVLSAPDDVPYYLTGLRAPRIRIPDGDEHAPVDALRASGTTFVISTPFLRTYAVHVARCVDVFPERFEVVDHEGDVRVYRMLRDPETAPAPSSGSPAAIDDSLKRDGVHASAVVASER